MKKHIVALGLIIVAAAQGCATTGFTRIDASRVPDIADFVQDRDQITQWFGSPEETERVAGARGCVEAWHWSHPTPATYENLTVYFDAQGVVCGHAYSGVRVRGQVARYVAPRSNGAERPALLARH